MKIISKFLLSIIVLISFSTSAQQKECYQIKTYNLKSEAQLNVTENYLKEAYLPALKRIGIKAVGVFKPKTFSADSITKLIVVIPFKNAKQFLQLDQKLTKDPIYLETGADYINAKYNQAPYERIESVLLTAFSNHPFITLPKLDSPRSGRVYELRSYESATEAIYNTKVDMFIGGEESKIFDRLEFNRLEFLNPKHFH